MFLICKSVVWVVMLALLEISQGASAQPSCMVAVGQGCEAWWNARSNCKLSDNHAETDCQEL